MDIKSKKHCPSCSILYSSKDNQAQHVPLLLPCGHNSCANCIEKSIRGSENLQCQVCYNETILSESLKQMMLLKQHILYEQFPIDYFTYGKICADFLTKADENDYKKDHNNYYINLKKIMQEDDNITSDCNECNVKTKMKCQQCDIVLCDSCFKKIHNYLHSFKHHTHERFDSSDIKIQMCLAHQNPFNYYCQDCCKPLCIDCLVIGGKKSCKTHTISLITERNVEMRRDLESLMPALDETLRRLSASAIENAKLLEKIDQGHGSNINDVIKNTQDYFSKLTYTIQKTEAVFINHLENIQRLQKESLLYTKSEIANNFKTIHNIIDRADMIIKGDKKFKITVSSLLESARNVIDTPWFLMQAQSDVNIDLVLNTEIFKTIEDCVKYNENVDMTYKLVATKDIAEGVVIPPAPDAIIYPPELNKVVPVKITHQTPSTSTDSTFNQAISTYNEKFEPSYSLSYDFPDQLPICSSKSTVDSTEDATLNIGFEETVKITHIEDPHNFYVQRLSQKHLLMSMNKNINSFQSPVSEDLVQIKHIYLGYNDVLKKWRRARIEKKIKDVDLKTEFEILFVDYGFTDIVTSDKLRLIPSSYCVKPSLAIPCKLANCEPIDGTWKPDDTTLMKTIINNKDAMMFVRFKISEPNLKYECDIVMCEDDVSLAHSLKFYDRARLIKPYAEIPTLLKYQKKPMLLYRTLNELPTSASHKVFITHVVNPEKFYVREVHLMRIFVELCAEMDKTYKVQVSSDIIHYPTKGMPCAVHVDTKRGSYWRRATIWAVLCEQIVTVYIPDTGEVLDVHCSKLRRIKKPFLKHKALSIECHLSGVVCPKITWSQESTDLLNNYLDCVLTLQVDKYVSERNSTSVILYRKSEGNDTLISINNKLVEKNLAVSVGNTELNIKPKKHKDNDENQNSTETGPLKVRILSCKSPSLIYVSLVNQESTMQELYEKIQSHFSRKQSLCNRQWQVDDMCCGYSIGSDTWRRAVITSITGPQVTLFFTDFANTETVTYRDIFELPTQFAQEKNAAIRCHMDNILPSVGEEWPSVANKYLKDLIKNYQTFFITKYGNVRNTNKSWPIELWTRAGNESGLFCVNDKIIQQGLAIPDKSKKKSNNTLKDFLNIADMNNEAISTSAAKRNERTTWIPADPLAKTEFKAIPTFIDGEGFIYIQDLAQEDTVDNLRRLLADIKRNQPTSVLLPHTDWQQGEACLARFYLDNNLYRANIINVYPDENRCLVTYVDFGNECTCPYEDIIKLNEAQCDHILKIPIQSYKCFLKKYKPPAGKRWESRTLDRIYDLTVDNPCLVRITDEDIKEPIPIEIKLSNNKWVHEVLETDSIAHKTYQ